MRDKVIVVTGASSGIGAAVAELLASRGAKVVLAARRKEALDAVAAKCENNAAVVVADVSRRDEIKRIIDEAIARFGRIDVWINNAGRGITRIPSELTDADIDEMMQINVKAALYAMQAVLPHFKARGDGHIINISSMLGRVPFALPRSAYSASKHFLNSLTANFRTEVHATHPGIQISLVSPGIVATDFGLHANHGGPDSRSLPGTQTAEEVAVVIADVVQSRRADVYTRPDGQQIIARYYTNDIE
jgi:short-subunit dehydrogenase